MSILYLEPYYGGSHKQMIDLLQREFGGVVYTLPDNKWHWRMRLSGLHFAELVPPLKEPHPQFKLVDLYKCDIIILKRVLHFIVIN